MPKIAPVMSWFLVALGAAACSTSTGDPKVGASDQPAKAAVKKVGYDLRLLRPRDEEPLKDMFDRMRKQAQAEGKQVAVLFSADWCEPCKRLNLELGNMHPEADIGHVRILELKEEDWEKVTRMNEFNSLRSRWDPVINVYPLLVFLDQHGKKVEEMLEAKERMDREGREATLAAWFREFRTG